MDQEKSKSIQQAGEGQVNSAVNDLSQDKVPNFAFLRKGKAAGLKLSMNTVSFLNPERPLWIVLTIGYDRRTDAEFLYIEPRGSNTSDKDFASIIDGCNYNSLMDPKRGTPLTAHYLGIFIKYKIYIPIEVYEILTDIKYTDPSGKEGYVGLVKDISKVAFAKFANNFVAYYKPFELLILGYPYENPLNQAPSAPVLTSSSPLVWNFSGSATDELGRPLKNDDPNQFVNHALQMNRPLFGKNRLILGESNFSFSTAFCKKHPTLANKIVATEYISEKELLKTHGTLFTDNIKYLTSVQVTIKYEVDARKIHELFQGCHFKYIHFNNPNDRSDYYQANRSLPELIKGFFSSAYELQKIGDKIYMSLPTDIIEAKQNEREGYFYKVYDAAAASGYRYVDKKPFDIKRYPGYSHTMTGSKKSTTVAGNCKEYIFRKIEPLVDAPQTVQYKSPTEEHDFHSGKPYADKGHVLPDIDTSSDTSSHYSDSEDKFELGKDKVVVKVSGSPPGVTTPAKTYASALMSNVKAPSASSSATHSTVINLRPIAGAGQSSANMTTNQEVGHASNSQNSINQIKAKGFRAFQKKFGHH